MRGKQTQTLRGAPKLQPCMTIEHEYDVDACPKLYAAGINEDLIYALSCLLSAGFVHTAHVDKRFLDALRKASKSPEQVKQAEAALFRMWYQRRQRYDIYTDFTKELSKAGPQRISDLKDYCMVRSACVTPSRVLFLPPLLEQTNRVLLAYDSTRFMRASFVDEDYSQLDFYALSVDVCDRIRDLLKQGIGTPVGSCRYQFLAFSSSQLRSHGCWFFQPTESLSIEKLISQLGNFSGQDRPTNTTVAKYAARVGLWFSTGRTGIKHVPPAHIRHLADIENSAKECFSDGAGTLSKATANQIARKLKLNRTPSAFQIRFGGYKGVLRIDASLGSAHAVCLRPSMKKFESSDRRLFVLSHSKPIPGYLNHQVISILSTLGVPDKPFLDLQKRALNGLKRITTTDDGARSHLNRQQEAHKQLLDILNRFGRKEPFVANCLAVIQHSAMRELKFKARIYVPQASAAVGVLDETGLLKRDQVFFRCKGRTITGEVLVAKFPALHPGDVRKFTAVTQHMLHDIVDCLVFPKTHSGDDRPHTSQLSGADLDGDLFFVCWDKALMFKGRNRSPGTYSNKHAADKNPDTITQAMVADFFVEFMQNDAALGEIANLHKGWADRSPKGVDDPECVALAELHGQAVGYVKSGIKVELPSWTLTKWPHFMCKQTEPCYTSRKILGKLFDKVTLEEPKFCVNIELDPDLLVEGHERAYAAHNKTFVEQATRTKAQYDREVRGIISQYGLQTEAELFTGCLIKRGPDVRKNRLFNLRELLAKLVKQLQDRYRYVFYREDDGGDSDGMDIQAYSDDERRKASAWYVVTYRPTGHRPGMKAKAKAKLLSFAWVMHDVLDEIKHRHQQQHC